MLVPFTYLIPLRYALEIIRAGWLKGSSVTDLWQPLLGLVAFSVATFTVAVTSFHKRLSD